MERWAVRLAEALQFYADPETYHAVAFLFDRPCGGFDEDFERQHGHPDYQRHMPGKLARRVLRQITKEAARATGPASPQGNSGNSPDQDQRP